MRVEGNEAKLWDAVRLDSMETINKAELVSADEETGSVSWKDKTGTTQSVTLGQHVIKLVRVR